jgi:hypothetical protein
MALHLHLPLLVSNKQRTVVRDKVHLRAKFKGLLLCLWNTFEFHNNLEAEALLFRKLEVQIWNVGSATSRLCELLPAFRTS